MNMGDGCKLIKLLLWFRVCVFHFSEFAIVSQDHTKLVMTFLSFPCTGFLRLLHAGRLLLITWKKVLVWIRMYTNEGFSYHFKHITCTWFDRLNVPKISRRELFQPHPVTLERKGKEYWWDLVVSLDNCPFHIKGLQQNYHDKQSVFLLPHPRPQRSSHSGLKWTHTKQLKLNVSKHSGQGSNPRVCRSQEMPGYHSEMSSLTNCRKCQVTSFIHG